MAKKCFRILAAALAADKILRVDQAELAHMEAIYSGITATIRYFEAANLTHFRIVNRRIPLPFSAALSVGQFTWLLRPPNFVSSLTHQRHVIFAQLREILRMKQTIKEMLRELEEEHRKSLPPGQRLTAAIGQTASFVVAHHVNAQ
jgi:hypothetical protein